MNKRRLFEGALGVLILLLLSGGVQAKVNCQVIYDAGSSGTRLYIYEQQGQKWLGHEGPKVEALADSVRGIRGKNWADVDQVIATVVSALDEIRKDGPMDKKDKPKWFAFDWQKQCHLNSVEVLATAGMRLAEQENMEQSSKLWRKLHQSLQAKVGKGVPVSTRTLTGFEEGLYAWLAVRQTQENNDFGIVEMGGASSQTAFPCKDCQRARSVWVDGKKLPIYSYSYLGLGQDEAPKSLGLPKSCAYGIGVKNSDWSVQSCRSQIVLKSDQGLRDPYNMGASGYGTVNQVPLKISGIKHWILTGAFKHMNPKDVDNCCLSAGQCYEPQTACYRAVYLPTYLDALGVVPSQTQDPTWTYGAALCHATNCLKDAGTLQCRWSKQGCLHSTDNP